MSNISYGILKIPGKQCRGVVIEVLDHYMQQPWRARWGNKVIEQGRTICSTLTAGDWALSAYKFSLFPPPHEKDEKSSKGWNLIKAFENIKKFMHWHWTIWMRMRMSKWAKFCLWLLLFQVVTSRQLWFSRSESQFLGMWGFLCSVFPTIGARYLYTAIQLYLLSTGAFTAKWPPKLARAENCVLVKKL